MYAAMDDRLTISSRELGENVTIFYRTPAMTDADGRVNDFRMADPVKMLSQPGPGGNHSAPRRSCSPTASGP